MATNRLRKIEFESRIFISFTIVLVICTISFTLFSHHPTNAIALGEMINLEETTSRVWGFVVAIIFMITASFIRIWSGSLLTSQRMMAFKVQVDGLVNKGPYLLSRNPIYLADLIAFCGFTLCLPLAGLAMPLLLYIHYTQLIKYEEEFLLREFRDEYRTYIQAIPRILPSPRSLRSISAALGDLYINWDGFRHNALYLLFIPGFMVSAFTGKLIWAVIIGLPAVFDWAVVHTKKGIAKHSSVAGISQKKVFKDILYAQCWEDPQVDREALKIKKSDVVFSITSGGCNVLTFLLDNPKKIIALDLNPFQNYLLNLKIAAFKCLSYEELLRFFGVRQSGQRLDYYRRLRPCLEPGSLAYWDGQGKKIMKGIIHCGKYEKYMQLLKKTVIALIFSPSILDRFFSIEDPGKRRYLFDKKIKNIRWWILTRIMLSRLLNRILFEKAFFTFLSERFSFGSHFGKKAERALTQLPLKNNYFLSYILLGRYLHENYLPHYLKRSNYIQIKKRIDRIEVVTGNCEEYFQTLPGSTISKFNFSNIFEWMAPQAFKNLQMETIRVATHGAIMVYRNLLVFREHHASLEPYIESDRKLARSLLLKDLSFIYNNYVVEKIKSRGEG